MEKIDRLGWAAGLSFTAYGVRVGVRVSQPDALEQLADHLPPGWEPAPSAAIERLYSLIIGGPGPRPGRRRFHLLYGNAAQLARSMEIEQVLSVLESDLQLYVAEFAPDRLFVHAGVVGWKGQAILIPGRSFTGKSTLVAELVRAGATYYSDEYAVLDTQGRTHPYPRPISLRRRDSTRGMKYRLSDSGIHPGVEPLPVGLVVVSEYAAGAEWQPRGLTAGEGAMALLANTVSARRQPETAFSTLQKVVTRATVLQSERGEARQVAGSILESLNGCSHPTMSSDYAQEVLWTRQ